MVRVVMKKIRDNETAFFIGAASFRLRRHGKTKGLDYAGESAQGEMLWSDLNVDRFFLAWHYLLILIGVYLD